MKRVKITMMMIMTFVFGVVFTGGSTGMGVIEGSAADQQKHLLSGVMVTILETTQSVFTDQVGHFRINNVPKGKYTLRFDKSGYTSTTVKGVRVKSNETSRVEVTLSPYAPEAEDQEVLRMDALIEPNSVRLPALREQLSKCSIRGIAGDGMGRQIQHNTEDYDFFNENTFKDVLYHPLSTFSIDVDNASYANVRRFLLQNQQLPPADAVRIEEMINYFTYDYPQPDGEHPFNFITEAASCPWNKEHRLVHIGLQGKNLDYENLNPSNLVFLLDVSGSMSAENKLPLLKKAFAMLVDELGTQDRVAIVVYAGAAGLVLPSTPAYRKAEILASLEQLSAGGSTAGGAGIRLAYQVAQENYIPGGNNRVILATDGDFNVGISATGELVRYLEDRRKNDIYLTICGFGMGNYKDNRMEALSNSGNGNYFYIDNVREAEKVFVREMRANLFTIAKDVKIQVEFNPAQVQAYRLIGYENRMLNAEDFNDDLKDAGELGAGHTVTVLYEVVPVGVELDIPQIDDLKYQNSDVSRWATRSPELMTIKFRYKPPREDVSKLIEVPIRDEDREIEQCSTDFQFASAVAGFGMILRDSEYSNDLSAADVLALARPALGTDPNGDRHEFIRLVETCDLMQ